VVSVTYPYGRILGFLDNSSDIKKKILKALSSRFSVSAIQVETI
jgi:hypothetical protein